MPHSGLLLLLVGLLAFWAELALGSGQKPSPDLGHQCMLPPDTGPCMANFQHFYYNPHRQRCLPFTYGGCLGNSNNFETKAECEKACIEVCKLPSDSGPCFGNFECYYYDSAKRTCKTFVYGGCKGNGNRFHNRAECMIVCGNEHKS